MSSVRVGGPPSVIERTQRVRAPINDLEHSSSPRSFTARRTPAPPACAGAATGSGAVLPTWITAIFAVDLGAAAFLAWPLSPDELRLPSDGGERLGPRARAAAFLLLRATLHAALACGSSFRGSRVLACLRWMALIDLLLMAPGAQARARACAPRPAAANGRRQPPAAELPPTAV